MAIRGARLIRLSPAFAQMLFVENLATVVKATRVAHVMRAFQFPAIGTFAKGFGLQRIMRAAIATAGGRYFSLRNGHVGTLIASNCQKLFRHRHYELLRRPSRLPHDPEPISGEVGRI
jgi:hypothetical protein